MFRRKIAESLERWRLSPNHKPLILRGARQVGKSTAVDLLGSTFPNYLKFNLDKKTDRELFDMEMPLDDFVTLLFARSGRQREPGESLIFIDEIQNSPAAIAMLRYFREDRPDLHVVAAGSLLENLVDVKASFPVGRVDYMALRPCSFREFLGALEQSNLTYFIDNPHLSAPMHSTLMSLFNQYTIVGGMPEAVQAFAKKRDINALDNIYDSIVQGYRDDVEKYVRQGKLVDVVRFIIDRGWVKAGSKTPLGSFAGSTYKAQDVRDAFALLGKAMLAELAYPTTSAMVPALSELGRTPKVLMLDTGLANYKAGVRKELIGARDILDVWRGSIAEQVVGQELLTLNDKVGQERIFWTKGKDDAELDFVWVYDSQLFPIEVKNGHNSHLRSLHSFLDASPLSVGVRVWSGPFSVDDIVTVRGRKTARLINLPFYMVGSLESILSRYS